MAGQGMRQTQNLALQQVLSPQLQQSLLILQTPLLELRNLVQQEMETNPVLEELPDEPGADERGEVEPSVDDNFKNEFEKPLGRFRENGGVDPEVSSAGSRGARFARVFAHPTKARGKRKQPGVQNCVRTHGGFGQAALSRNRASDGDQCGGGAKGGRQHWGAKSASRPGLCRCSAKLCAAGCDGGKGGWRVPNHTERRADSASADQQFIQGYHCVGQHSER